MHPETHHYHRYRLITAAQQIVHQHSSPERQRRQREQGFTLIEMIIVLAVIGILAAIAIPQFSGILGGAQATVIAGELSSASASNVAVCRQRGLDHPHCVSTAGLADTQVRGHFSTSSTPSYKDNSSSTVAQSLTGLYGIHIGGAEVSSYDDDRGDVEWGDFFPDWTSSDDGALVDELLLACDPDVDTQWGNMQCAIAEFNPDQHQDADGHGDWEDLNYDNLVFPWENGATDPEVVETFQMTYIDASGD